MRLVKSVCLLAMLALIASAAMADKYEPNEKPWSYGPMYPRADYPEQEPNNTCPGPQQLQCGDRIVCGSYATTNDDDFYQVYLTAGTLVSIGTDACQGSSVDTYLQLYDPNCAGPVASDDDSGPGLFSLISNYNVPSTGWYNIKTYSYSHLYTGEYILFVTCTVPQPPDPNDTCTPDFCLEGQGVANGDMTWDNNNYDPLSGGCATGYPEAGKDVAYRVQLVAGQAVSLTYYTPNWDAAFYIVRDCANVPGTCIIGADAGYDTEYINFVPQTTETAYLILDHYGTNTGAGPWTLNYSGFGPCGAQPEGACCVDGRCTITTEAECGGQWLGPDYPTCEPNPCAVPTRETSWGQIKSNYR